MIHRLLFVVLLLSGILTGCAPKHSEQSSKVSIPATSKATPTAVAWVLPDHEQTQMPSPTLPAATSAPTSTPSSPTPTALPPTATAVLPSPTPAVAINCLVGTWQVKDMAQAMAESFAKSRSSFTLQRSSGQVLYQFLPDGEMTIAFDHLSATLEGMMDQRKVTAQQSLNGSATAYYQVEPSANQITFSNFGGDGVMFGLDINGQRVAEGNLPAWQAFTSSPGSANASPGIPVQESHEIASCSGDTLKLQAVAPVSGPIMDLQRLK